MVPEGFTKVPIGELVERVARPVHVEPDEHYLQIGIRSHGKGLFDKESVSGAALGNKRVFWVEPGCFVVNIVFAWEQAVGKTTASDIGKIASHRFPMYRPKPGRCDLDFLTYLFKTKYGKHVLTLASPGGAGRNKTLGQSEFVKSEIVVPPYEEQKKIAEILLTWDRAIETVEKLIANSRDQKKALMQRLLGGAEHFEGTKSKWTSFHFNQFAHRRKAKYDPVASNVDRPCIELEHVESMTGRLLGQTTAKGQDSIKSVFRSGDVLFGKLRPYLRKFNQPTFDGVCSSEFWVLNANEKICLPRYLYYVVQTWTFQRATSISSGSKMPRAEWDIVKDFTFALPSVEEQQVITNALDPAEKHIDALSGQLDALRAEKAALMQQLLTGKRRVKIEEKTA